VCVLCKKKIVQPNMFQMCEGQSGVVYCAMLLDIPHQIKILKPTTYWEKQIAQLISTIFYYVLFFNTTILLHISGVKGCRF